MYSFLLQRLNCFSARQRLCKTGCDPAKSSFLIPVLSCLSNSFCLPFSPHRLKPHSLTLTLCADSLSHRASLLLHHHFLHMENGTLDWKFARLVNKIVFFNSAVLVNVKQAGVENKIWPEFLIISKTRCIVSDGPQTKRQIFSWIKVKWKNAWDETGGQIESFCKILCACDCIQFLNHHRYKPPDQMESIPVTNQYHKSNHVWKENLMGR